MRIYSTEFILPILLGTQGYLTQGYLTRLFNRLFYPEFILRAHMVEFLFPSVLNNNTGLEFSGIGIPVGIGRDYPGFFKSRFF